MDKLLFECLQNDDKISLIPEITNNNQEVNRTK